MVKCKQCDGINYLKRILEGMSIYRHFRIHLGFYTARNLDNLLRVYWDCLERSRRANPQITLGSHVGD
jgi:hypothetical protein